MSGVPNPVNWLGWVSGKMGWICLFIIIFYLIEMRWLIYLGRLMGRVWETRTWLLKEEFGQNWLDERERVAKIRFSFECGTD